MTEIVYIRKWQVKSTDASADFNASFSADADNITEASALVLQALREIPTRKLTVQTFDLPKQ